MLRYIGYIITLVIVQNVLSYTHATTAKLQRSEGDIVKAYSEIELIKGTQQNTVRKHINSYNETWLDQATKLAETVGVSPSKPRTCSRQTLRANAPSETPRNYYRINLTTPFTDHLFMELNTRFDKVNLSLAEGFVVIPTIMTERVKQSGIGSWKAEFKEFLSAYESNLPNPRIVEAEMDIWETYWIKYVGVLPDRISSALRLCKEMELTFPNIYCLQPEDFGTIPVTTYECERSISSLRRLKSTMGEKRLNGLAALHVHNNISVDLEKIIDNFARKHSRRMSTINILDSDMSPDTTKTQISAVTFPVNCILL